MTDRYYNEGLNIIHKKYPKINFDSLDNPEPIFLAGELCEKLNIGVVFANLTNGCSGFFHNDKKLIV